MNSYLGDYFAYFAVVCVNFIAFTTGSAYSWTSPVLPKLNGLKNPEENPLPHPATALESSWIVSLISLGAAFGPIISGIISEKIGRKRTLLVFAIPMFLSHVMCAFANNVKIFYAARIMLGLGAGCVFSVLPNFVSEISEDSNRGLMGCIMGLIIAFGTVYNYLVGPFVTIAVLSYTSLVPIILFFVFFGIYVPESPYYYVSLDDREEAEKSLMKFRNKSNNEIQKELMYITKSVEDSKNQTSSIQDLVNSRSLRKGLLISCCIMVFQQFSGITAVLGYMEKIFEATGSSIPPEYSAIFIGSMQVAANIVTSALIDRFGRKIFLLISMLGTCISLTTLGIYFFLLTNDFNVNSIFWLPILSLFVYIITYNLGLGPLPWIIMGELFPSNVRSLASTITACVCLSLAFAISLVFEPISEILGMAGLFWLFSVFCLVGFSFTLIVIPETKGKSLQEIQTILNGDEIRKF